MPRMYKLNPIFFHLNQHSNLLTKIKLTWYFLQRYFAHLKAINYGSGHAKQEPTPSPRLA